VIWAARYLTMNGRRRLIGSFNHGSMANALPQAIGDLDSLVAAMNGADAVITTAAGYTRGGKNASATPTSPRPPTAPASGGSS
jgi:hypothetical protein